MKEKKYHYRHKYHNSHHNNRNRYNYESNSQSRSRNDEDAINRNTVNTSDNTLNSTSSIPNADASTQSKNNLEIPGFYYDEVKKRYFKIQPNHQQQTSIVTKDFIKTRESYKEVVKKQETTVENIFKSVIFNYELGIDKRLNDKRDDQIIVNLKQKSKIELDPSFSVRNLSVFTFDKTLDYVYLLLTIGNTVRSLKVKKDIDDWDKSYREMLFELFDYNNQFIETTYTEESDLHAYVQDQYLVTTNASSTVREYVSKLQIKRLSQKQGADNVLNNRLFVELSYKNALWCSTLNSSSYEQQQQISKCAVGSTNCGFVTNINRSNIHYRLNSLGSDVYCQRFHPIDNETFIYNGCHNKNIFGYDLRLNTKDSRSIICKLEHKSCVCDIQFHKLCSNYVFSTDYTGEIYLWDLRLSKCINTYTGNVNENQRHGIHLNEDGTYLYTVGQDGHTRIWNTKSNKLIRIMLKQVDIRSLDRPHVYLLDNLNMLYVSNNELNLYSI